jgi:cytochrome c oxidase subunit 2
LRIPGSQRRPRHLAAIAAILAFGLLTAACTSTADVQNATGDAGGPNLIGFQDGQIGFPHEVVTTQGQEAAGLYLGVFIIAVGIFLLVEGILLYAALRFRRKSTDSDLPTQTHGNNRLEFIWTAIPALIVLGLFVASTVVLTRVEAKSDDPGVVVDVEAFRFGWTFKYPDSGVSISGGGREGAPEMVVPIDEPVRFRVTAIDVIHSFYVPAFFYKLDAVPGRINEFEVTIEEPGVYGGQCAEFCGLAHSQMYFSVRAVERPEFDAWLAEQPPAGGPPPAEGPPAEGEAEPTQPPPAEGEAEPTQPPPAEGPVVEASPAPGDPGALEPVEAADQAPPGDDQATQADDQAAPDVEGDDSSPAEEPAPDASAPSEEAS